MNTNSTAGIDYGMGQSNIDHSTGIRYGVISQHTIDSDVLQTIYDNGENLTHKMAVSDAHKDITQALRGVLDSLGLLPYDFRSGSKNTPNADAYLAPIVESVWEEVEQNFNDRYEENEDTYRYEDDGYIIETSSLGIYVIKSPFYTYAAFCSPCAPGAGDLNTPRDRGIKTYCLGADWFESGAPYPIYRVSNDTAVSYMCDECDGENGTHSSLCPKVVK